jgi:hypothetical protein
MPAAQIAGNFRTLGRRELQNIEAVVYDSLLDLDHVFPKLGRA